VGCGVYLPPADCRGLPQYPEHRCGYRIWTTGNQDQSTKFCYKRCVLRVACCVLLYLSVFSAHDNGRGRAAYAPPLTPLLSLWLSLLITELGYLNFADDTSGE
jgi:hypothetical protein